MDFWNGRFSIQWEPEGRVSSRVYLIKGRTRLSFERFLHFVCLIPAQRWSCDLPKEKRVSKSVSHCSSRLIHFLSLDLSLPTKNPSWSLRFCDDGGRSGRNWWVSHESACLTVRRQGLSFTAHTDPFDEIAASSTNLSTNTTNLCFCRWKVGRSFFTCMCACLTIQRRTQVTTACYKGVVKVTSNARKRTIGCLIKTPNCYPISWTCCCGRGYLQG